MKFVRIFRYDPVRDPTARLRMEYDPDWGNSVLSDEDVHPEQVDNPDCHHLNVLASMQLTTACVRWLHETSGALLVEMERNDREAQEAVDRIRAQESKP